MNLFLVSNALNIREVTFDRTLVESAKFELELLISVRVLIRNFSENEILGNLVERFALCAELFFTRNR